MNWYFSKLEIHLLILGLDNAGKTTVLEQLKRKYLDEDGGKVNLEAIPPTVGLNIGRMTIADANTTVWDLGGQQSFRVIWDKYYEEANGLIYVIDSADEARFEECLATFLKIISHADMAGRPVLLFLNKQDRDDAHDLESLEAIFSSATKKCSGEVKFQPVSARTTEGLAEGIEWLVEHAKVQLEHGQEKK